MQITLGFFASLILMAIIYFLRNKAKDELSTYYYRMMIRAMVWSVLGGLFYFIPFSN